MTAANVNEELLAVMCQHTQRMAALEERLAQVQQARKRHRGEVAAEADTEMDYRTLCAQHALELDPETATTEDFVRALSEKLAKATQEERDYLWLKTRSKQEVEAMRKERDTASASASEMTRRAQMDRQFLESLQTNLGELRRSNQDLVERNRELQQELEKTRSEQDVETRREIARLRREVDTLKTQAQLTEEEHGRDAMNRMAEHQKELETLTGRVSRRDRTVAELRRMMDAKIHEVDGIKAIYGQVVAHRLEGARQALGQAVTKVLQISPGLSPEARMHLQVAQNVLDLAAIGNAPNAPLPVSVVQIQAPAPAPEPSPQQQRGEQEQQEPGRPESPTYGVNQSPFA